MKLTINHLKGYLDHKLKAEMLDYKIDYVGKQFDEIVGFHQWDKDGKYWSVLTEGGSKPSIDRIKPFLHPLSSLTKYREDLGFVPIKNLGHTIKFNDDFTKFSDNGGSMAADFYDLHWMPHKCIELFQQWHIDYQNLIPNNLATEIN